MTSGLCNPEYYRGVVLEIRKSIEVREEGMEVQEEAATLYPTLGLKTKHKVQGSESTSSA